MNNSKTPLPEERDDIDGNDRSNGNDRSDSNNYDDNNSQEVDLDNPMLHIIDTDSALDNSAGFDNSQAGSSATQGLTPIHYQNIDESRVDEVLVEDNLDSSDYPDISDIADKDAAERSHDDDL